MPDIQAFRGIRYDLGHVGSLSDVVAPAGEVLSEDRRDACYQRHPANVARLTHNRPEPGDAPQAPQTRASRFLRHWRRQGVLMQDAMPAIYAWHQVISNGGESVTRRGFVAALRLASLAEDDVCRYAEPVEGEAELEEPRALLEHCESNLAPVLAYYHDDDAAVQRLLDEAVSDAAPRAANGPDGTSQRIWPVTDLHVITDVAAAMAARPLFVAEGVRQYRAALAHAAERALDREHPSRFVMAACVGLSDSSFDALPAVWLWPSPSAPDRVGRPGEPGGNETRLRQVLGDWFELTPAGRGAAAAPAIWEELCLSDDPGALAICVGPERQWLTAQLNAAGRRALAEAAPDHSEEWCELGAAALQRLLLPAWSLRSADALRPLGLEAIAHQLQDAPRDALAVMATPPSSEQAQWLAAQHEPLPAAVAGNAARPLAGLILRDIS